MPARKTIKAQLAVNVMRVAGQWSRSIPGYSAKVKAWCDAALVGSTGDVSVVLADDAFVQDLNRTYRGKNKPTNVLSFPGDNDELGDVLLAYETVKKEASEQGKRFADHAAHLVVHGCLHLLGYDHERARDAEKMEALEVRILRQLGVLNPYLATH
jgi:probable rRNA maturation factor